MSGTACCCEQADVIKNSNLNETVMIPRKRRSAELKVPKEPDLVLVSRGSDALTSANRCANLARELKLQITDSEAYLQAQHRESQGRKRRSIDKDKGSVKEVKQISKQPEELRKQNSRTKLWQKVSRSKTAELQEELGLASKERDAYLGKLREIELLCQSVEHKNNLMTGPLLDILYRVDEGFSAPDVNDDTLQVPPEMTRSFSDPTLETNRVSPPRSRSQTKRERVTPDLDLLIENADRRIVFGPRTPLSRQGSRHGDPWPIDPKSPAASLRNATQVFKQDKEQYQPLDLKLSTLESSGDWSSLRI